MELPQILIDLEFKNLIPPLTDDERRDLEASLQADGCISPLILWQGHSILLDGHNRYEFCLKHGIQCEVREIVLDSREAAKTWVIKNQLGRRNLNESQRAMLAATLKDVFSEGAKQRQKEHGGTAPGKPKEQTLPSNLTEVISGEARQQAAEAMNVSAGLVHAAEKVKSRGSEKLQRAVMSGEASVSAAAEVASLPKDQQDEVVDAGKKEIVAAAKKVRRTRTRRSGRGQISPDALTPVRKAVPLPAKTALDLPHDPVWAAKTLISVFDREFLVGLVSEITLFLHGDTQ